MWQVCDWVSYADSRMELRSCTIQCGQLLDRQTHRHRQTRPNALPRSKSPVITNTIYYLKRLEWPVDVSGERARGLLIDVDAEQVVVTDWKPRSHILLWDHVHHVVMSGTFVAAPPVLQRHCPAVLTTGHLPNSRLIHNVRSFALLMSESAGGASKLQKRSQFVKMYVSTCARSVNSWGNL